ncbi:hypothetical protein X949_4379 [Burkholderia pseudomallei MSHR5609]|nr:hypothetical protein X949_4379 [Burkholderia pseudomallei MSHR5609]
MISGAWMKINLWLLKTNDQRPNVIIFSSGKPLLPKSQHAECRSPDHSRPLMGNGGSYITRHLDIECRPECGIRIAQVCGCMKL